MRLIRDILYAWIELSLLHALTGMYVILLSNDLVLSALLCAVCSADRYVRKLKSVNGVLPMHIKDAVALLKFNVVI